MSSFCKVEAEYDAVSLLLKNKHGIDLQGPETGVTMSRYVVSPVFVLALLGASATCGRSPTGPVPPGDWGGQHIGMVVNNDGATIEYDCATGTIDQALLAADGTFTAVGTHTRGHGGPVRQDEVPDKHPARYDGHTDGKTMTLDVTLTDSGDKLGTFTLQRGASPNVFKCL